MLAPGGTLKQMFQKFCGIRLGKGLGTLALSMPSGSWNSWPPDDLSYIFIMHR